jgi:serine/threonine protein kinase
VHLILGPELSGKMPAEDKKEKKKKKNGTHSFMVNSCKFVIDSHYHPLKPLGRGAYGVVCSAIDKSRGEKKVAIKKIQGAFEDLVDGKRILREVKLLRHFRHENICGLVDLAPSPANVAFDDLYIVLDFMETDLHKIIYSKNKLSDEHIQYFIYQVLKGLKFIHSANVLHRDLVSSCPFTHLSPPSCFFLFFAVFCPVLYQTIPTLNMRLETKQPST